MDVKVAKAKAEIRSIGLKIQELSERRDALEKFLAVYAEFSDGHDQDHSEDEELENQFRRAPINTVKAKALNAACEILADGKARHTRELLSELQSRAVEIGGADKVQALSALLSKDDRFVPDRKYGWSLKAAEPASVGAEAGSFFNSGSDPDPTP